MRSTITRLKRGDIFWIRRSEYRETVGSVQAPGRPGIIVSNDANNHWANTIEIVYLTTAPKKKLQTHCTIESAESTSTALCEQVTTVSTEQIGQYVGHCTEEEMAAVDRCIAISLGLEAKQGDIEDDLNIALLKAKEREETITKLYHDLLDRMTAR